MRCELKKKYISIYGKQYSINCWASVRAVQRCMPEGALTNLLLLFLTYNLVALNIKFKLVNLFAIFCSFYATFLMLVDTEAPSNGKKFDWKPDSRLIHAVIVC